MRTFQAFAIDGIELLQSLRSVGLYGFASNRRDFGTHISVSTVWLGLGDGTLLRLRPEMHDLEGWDEVGSLQIDQVEPSGAVPSLTKLADKWREIVNVEKLVVREPDYFSAESGLKITNSEQEVIVICNGAAPYELALSMPAIRDRFNPEYSLERYELCPVFPA